MSSEEAKASVMIIFNFVSLIALIACIAPYLIVLICGGDFTFSSKGLIPQMKELIDTLK